MFVTDSHQKVLSAWAQYRASLTSAPALISLDHHTDTSPPFRKFLGGDISGKLEQQGQLLSKIQFEDSESVESAMSKLSNDEHIIAALESDILSMACIVAHNAMDTDVKVFRENKIICHEVRDDEWSDVLQSNLLERALLHFEKILKQDSQSPLSGRKYILDIDLDYFNTFESIKPSDSNVIRRLAKNAGLVTVATEPAYVESCAVESGLTSDYLLEKLKKLLD